MKVFNENNKNEYSDKKVYLDPITKERLYQSYESQLESLSNKIVRLETELEIKHSYYHQFIRKSFIYENNLQNEECNLRIEFASHFKSEDVGKVVGIVNTSGVNAILFADSPQHRQFNRLPNGIILAVYRNEILIVESGTIPLRYISKLIQNYDSFISATKKNARGYPIYMAKETGLLYAALFLESDRQFLYESLSGAIIKIGSADSERMVVSII
ncbi:hypothetical protein [Leptospira yasudae]|uniref:hypothetical protein n=1 Tax=Leptospira yasudae TaxID=2202201 RepID=UPI0010911A9B|nr:hypothetical protein [Leptospira yasudae]TGM99686.1 hypothetical protein EHR10_08830 [Leptospira yasudae]